jgi:hypothetical protein
MNPLPIETAQDADLRHSAQALQRAADRAHELAARTGTSIIISLGGVLKEVRPEQQARAPVVQEPQMPCADPP